MDILGIADVLDGSGEDSRAVQDMAASLAQQLGADPTPRPGAQNVSIRSSPSPGVARTIGVSSASSNVVHTNVTTTINGIRPGITIAAATPQFVNVQTVGQASNGRPQLTAAQRPDTQQSMALKLQESQMREKVNRLRQLLGRLIEMATQKDEKFGQVMRDLVKKLLDGNISDSKFITEIDRIGGIKLSSQAANFPQFLSTTLPYLRFQLQQETQAIFQQKAQKRGSTPIKAESPASVSPSPVTLAIPSPGPSPSVPSTTPPMSVASVATPSTAAASPGSTTATVTPATAAAVAAAVGAATGGGGGVASGGAPVMNPTALRAFLQAAGQQKMMEALKNPQLYHLFVQRQQALAAKNQPRPQAPLASAASAPSAATTTAASTHQAIATTTAPAAAPTAKTQAPQTATPSTATASVSTPSTAVTVPKPPQPVATASASATTTTAPTPSKSSSTKSKAKAKEDAPGDDDNDVTLVGGVNLREETAILAGAEHAPLQTQTCGDQTLLAADPLRQLIEKKVKACGLESATPEVTQLMSHAIEAHLRDVLEKLTAINQHRAEHYKEDSRVEFTTQVRSQLRFLEDIDKHNTKKRQEQHREMLLKAARSRARPDDPEAALLKEKARQVQHEEDELMRKNAANVAALNAIGPRRKRKADEDISASTESSASAGTAAAQPYATQLRTRQRRIGLKDYLFYLEQEKQTRHSKELYKGYLKQT